MPAAIIAGLRIQHVHINLQIFRFEFCGVFCAFSKITFIDHTSLSQLHGPIQFNFAAIDPPLSL